MAKTARKKPGKTKGKGTQPGNGNDAATFALIHWFTLAIEKLAIEIYVTDADAAGALVKVLKASLTDLGHVKAVVSGKATDEECPPGWEYCENRGRCCGECGTAGPQSPVLG